MPFKLLLLNQITGFQQTNKPIFFVTLVSIDSLKPGMSALLEKVILCLLMKLI